MDRAISYAKQDLVMPDLASAGPDSVLAALPGARTERLIIGHQHWKASRVRHRRIP
jgi:hypothetical protein